MAFPDSQNTDHSSLLSLSQSSLAPVYRLQHSLSLTEELDYRPSEALSIEDLPEPSTAFQELLFSQRSYFDLQIASLKTQIDTQSQQMETIHSEKLGLLEELETLKQELRGNREELERKEGNWQRERLEYVRELEKYRAASSNRSPRSKEMHLQLIKDLEKDIKALSLRLSAPNTPKRPKSRLKDPAKLSNSRLIEDLSQQLNTNKGGLVVSIQRLVAERDSQRRILAQLASLVQQLSPPSAFPQLPTPPQVWNWVNRLVDEYMELKRSLKGLRGRLQAVATNSEPIQPRELREMLRWGPRLGD